MRSAPGTLGQLSRPGSGGLEPRTKALESFLDEQAFWEELGEQAREVMQPVFRALLTAGAEVGQEEIVQVGEKFNPSHDARGGFASGPGGGGQVAMAADQLLSQASGAEKAVTSEIFAVATTHGGEMVGLGFRLKSKESLERKIASEARLKGISPKAAADQIGDSLRYTIVFSSSKYSKGSDGVVKDLQGKGFRLQKARNFWDNKEYRGINTQFVSPGGHRFELQFHTSRSWDIKQNKSHPLYEKLRVTKSPSMRTRLTQQTTALWSKAAAPVGAAAIGWAVMVKELIRALLRRS